MGPLSFPSPCKLPMCSPVFEMDYKPLEGMPVPLASLVILAVPGTVLLSANQLTNEGQTGESFRQFKNF